MNDHGRMRTMVRGAYDLQKLRIQMGNRIVGNFKVKLGQVPGETEDELDEDAKAVLKDLRLRYKKLTDGVKTFPRQASFKGDEVISTYTELCLIAQYVSLEDSEAQHFRRLGNVLTEYPIWTEFLEGVSGVGPAMAGVIISEMDIHKARYPSSLWAYAGLDVVGQWVLGDTRFVCGDRVAAEAWVAEGHVPERRPLVGDVDPNLVTFTADGPMLTVQFARAGFTVLGAYDWVSSGGRSRKKDHLREVAYTDKNGKPATRVGITFNPWLKTKLIGVLASSFLRVRDSPYAAIYYGYKHRLESHEVYGTANDTKTDSDGKKLMSKGRRDNMAKRYMIKEFLKDLYKAWRPLEGLEVSPPYQEAKLGIKHGGDAAAVA